MATNPLPALQPPMQQPFGRKLIAGDAWNWTITLPNYDASLFTLKYFFRGGGGKLDVVATGSGTTYTVAVLPADSTKLNKGAAPMEVGWQACVFDASANRLELGRGTVTVMPDVAAQNESFDGRTQTKQIHDAIRAVLLGLASRQEQQYQIGGRHLVMIPRHELLDLESEFAARVRRELVDSGQLPPQNNQVQVRF